MRGRKRKFSLEFKIEAVKRAFAEGASTGEVAEELGIDRGMFYKWRELLDESKALKRPGQKDSAATLKDQVRRLQKELERVREERDILKKAAAYFANELK